MGLSGPIPLRDPARGNPGRRQPKGPRFTPEVQAQLQEIFQRQKALGDYYGTVAEAETQTKSKAPSPALWAALKCWAAASTMAFRIGGLATPEETDELEAHLKRRPKPPKVIA